MSQPESKSKLDLATFKFEDLNALRGETPQDIQDRAYQLCSEYLGGAWLKINSQEMVLKRITGGYTDQHYYCALPHGIKPESGEPNEVALRLYGPKTFTGLNCGSNVRFVDTVVTLMMSQHNLGPLVYSVFPSGEIQKYYHVSFLK